LSREFAIIWLALVYCTGRGAGADHGAAAAVPGSFPRVSGTANHFFFEGAEMCSMSCQVSRPS